ncbi:MAG: hypothetical protein H8E31_08775, partial [Planctomycetes bacterium]|nr:hypothetical protein [Planctomycetota bacterium]
SAAAAEAGGPATGSPSSRALSGRGRAARSFPEPGLRQLTAAARRHFEQSRVEVQDQLDDLELRLDQRRDAIQAEQARLELQLEVSFDPHRNALAGEMRRRFAAAGLDGPAHQELLEQLIGLVMAELRRVQGQLVELHKAQHERELDIAERRISKLAATLKATERNLRKLAESKGFDPGLASIYREVQGLSEEDALAELKREMLSKIFEANLKLREERAADGDRR